MRKKEGYQRDAMQIISLEDKVSQEDEVRIIDEIVNEINLEELGYKRKERKNNAGRPYYGEQAMLKLYIYGYRNGVRSGRKLEEACKYDARFQWLMEGLEPDKNTINDFRRINKELLKKVFYEINRLYVKTGILKLKDTSQDGFKQKAVNSKERNYTVNKIADRIRREEERIEEENRKVDEYLDRLDKEEEREDLEQEIERKREELERLDKKLDKHRKLLEEMVEEGENQISLTDKESRLMKNNGKYEVCYNVQTAVDVESHITVAYEVSNEAADIGSLKRIGAEIKREYGEEQVIKNVTDKGYNSIEDMTESLEMGIIPEVTPMEERDEIELETVYEERVISEEERKSTKGKDIKKCLRAGVIPECYKEVIKEIRVEEVEKRERKEEETEEKRSVEEIREEAIKGGTFERDIRTGLVYCPMGEILGKKSSKGKEKIAYRNKVACERCKSPCTNKEYKEVTFRGNQKRVIPKNAKTKEKSEKAKYEKIKVKKVKIVLELDKELIKKRMQTSEHTQGTMKTSDNFRSFNVKGKAGASAEIALHLTASNIRRVVNMIGVDEMRRKLKEYRENEAKKVRETVFFYKKLPPSPLFKNSMKKITPSP